ncbi:MAG: hypothetical protein Q9176_003874 [Flavoplaca citrina]
MILAFNLFSTSYAGDRKTSTSAEPTDCPTRKSSGHTNSVQLQRPLLESNRETTPAGSRPLAGTQSGDPRKFVKRIKPSKGAKPNQEELVERGRKIIQSVKKRFSHLLAALGVGKRRPIPRQDSSPSAVVPPTFGSLTAISEDAGPQRANHRESLAQHQQETVRDTQSTKMNNPTAASHSTEKQPATSDALQAVVGSSKRGRDPHKPIDGRDVMDGSDSASSYQGQEESSAGENQATPSAPIQTLGSDTSEKLADGAASSSEDCKRAKWKRTFLMVLHLAKEGDATRVTCLDTGADINVISIDVVNSLQLAKEPYQGPALKPIGGTYLPEWQVRFDWHVAHRTKTYTSIFAVLDKDHSADFDILLGKGTVEDVGFYKVNSRVWFNATVDEAELTTGNDGTPLGFPSIEVEKGEDGPQF